MNVRSIDVAADIYEFPATPTQRALWFVHRLDPASPAYNIPLTFRLRGPLDEAALERAFAALARRHEILRTRFAEREGVPVQRVPAEAALDWRSERVTEPGAAESCRARAALHAAAAFDLTRDAPLRVRLERFTDDDALLVVVVHHIAVDHLALGQLARELAELYREGPDALPEPPLQFADYAVWLQELLGQPESAARLAVWQRRLAGCSGVLDLPTDRPRPPLQTSAGAEWRFQLPAALAAQARQYARGAAVSLYTVLLGALTVLLQRYSGQSDIIVGTPFANRGDQEELERVVGCFINTLPIVTRFDGIDDFPQLLAGLKAAMLEAFEAQDVALEAIVEAVNPRRDPSYNPLFQVGFVLQEPPVQLRLDGVEAQDLQVHSGGAMYDLHFWLWEAGDTIAGLVWYNTDLFEPGTVARLTGHYQAVLEQLVAAPAAPLAAVTLLTAAEREQLAAWNATGCDWPAAASVVDLVRAQAQRTPDQVAVTGPAQCHTYAELEHRSDRLAGWLLARGAGPGALVGIALERDADLLVGLLGILKTGAAYVPLDPDYPDERLKYMLEQADVRLLVTQQALQAELPDHDCERVLLDRDWPAIAAAPVPALPVLSPELCMYVIFTSGSTGAPKGVQVPHRSVINFLHAMAERPGFAAGERLLAVTTLSFDIAVLELYLPLVVGAQLVIAGGEDAKDGHRLAELLRRHRITTLQATPSTWRLLRAAGWQGGAGFRVFTGGEALPQNLADELAGCAGEVWNLYGPTETTVWSTVARVRAGAPVTLGRPLANTRLQVVDEQGRPVAIGLPGELLIGGAGVTLGYWRRPELTAERYIEFDGERYYRTGDRVRFDGDGELRYLGRIDNQVKLRGYRIELGEIESRLLQLPGIAEAAVVVQDFGEGDQRLVAFYRPQAAVDPAGLRERLASGLPGYMVPQQLVALERFPLTPNGKVDRKKLAAQRVIRAIAESAPEPAGDPRVLALFRRFLQRPELAAGDDFFDHGGHSLLAMRLLAELNKELEAALQLTDIFTAPNAAALSRLLLQRGTGIDVAGIPRQPERTRFPLSLQQRRLWYLEQLTHTSLECNLPAAWRLRGPLDRRALGDAIDGVIARHDVLRVNLVEGEDGPFQHVHPARPGILEICEPAAAGAEPRLAAALADIGERTRRNFDLAAEPLIRLVLYPLAENDHLLFLLVHHVVFDGWSFELLLAELEAGYNAAVEGRRPALPELAVQYGDYAVWARQAAERDNDADLRFWAEHLAGELPTLELPAIGPRPAFQTHQGASVVFSVEAAPMAALDAFARRQGATLYMVLLALYKIVLWRYSGQRDLIVGTSISGRNHAETNPLIGFFANVLALRDRLDPDAGFCGFLQQVRQTCLAAFAHQEMPFEQLVEAVNPPRDTSRTPIFQVMLLYQNVSNRADGFTGLDKQQLIVDRAGVETDLDLWLKYDGRGLIGGFDYGADLFERSLIEAMAADFAMLIERVPRDFEAPVRHLAQLPSAALDEVSARLNATDAAVAAPALVHRLVEAQVDRTPDAEASWYRGVGLSYQELDRRANRIAHWLEARGIGPGALIGVALAPGEWLQAALLGVLKHGAAYVPIDPLFPLERIRYMIENAGLALLISDALLDERVAQEAPVPVVGLAELQAALDGQPSSRPARSIDPEQLAYVIYTSGSTGQPKGVMVKHRGVANYLSAMAAEPGFDAGDRILAATTLSFDIAVTELLLPLACGGASVLIDRDMAGDGDLLRDVIEHAEVNVIQATPSSWRLLLGAGWSGGKRIKALCGGEELPLDLIERLLPKVGELWNLYGPTETTVWSTLQRVTAAEQVGLIGTPLANTTCYILDERQQRVPLGVPGELCIGGWGVAAGYLNRPALTAERFIDNPFGPGRLYRTGDLARLLPSGRLLYLGRGDQQVKLRGFRIELGEIEAAIGGHPAVLQTVAVVKEMQPDDRRLVAYVVWRPGQRQDAAALRRFLRDYLPGYMQPQHIVELDALPMTPNRKIDRNALPMPTAEPPAQDARLPETAMQQALAAIWREVLGIDRVVLEDNFFDSGGHSLTAMDAIRRIQQQTGHRFEVREFILETFEQLSAKLEPGAPKPADGAPSRPPALLGRLMKRLTGMRG